jgi:hypothetical protein
MTSDETEAQRKTSTRKLLAAKLIPILQESIDQEMPDEAYIISAFIAAMMIGHTTSMVLAIAKVGKP